MKGKVGHELGPVSRIRLTTLMLQLDPSPPLMVQASLSLTKCCLHFLSPLQNPNSDHPTLPRNRFLLLVPPLIISFLSCSLPPSCSLHLSQPIHTTNMHTLPSLFETRETTWLTTSTLADMKKCDQ